MLVVDSSVWIDFFNDVEHPAVEVLQQLLDRGEVSIVVPDLVLFEVLRGFRLEGDLRQARRLLGSLSVQATGSVELALAAVHHYRSLRARGITVRGAIDVLVATFCVENDYALLHRDHDYDAFEELRGLKVWRH